MDSEKVDETDAKAPAASAVRASISFPPNIYRTLEDIARRKKVSLAWVVRRTICSGSMAIVRQPEVLVRDRPCGS